MVKARLADPLHTREVLEELGIPAERLRWSRRRARRSNTRCHRRTASTESTRSIRPRAAGERTGRLAFGHLDCPGSGLLSVFGP